MSRAPHAGCRASAPPEREAPARPRAEVDLHLEDPATVLDTKRVAGSIAGQADVAAGRHWKRVRGALAHERSARCENRRRYSQTKMKAPLPGKSTTFGTRIRSMPRQPCRERRDHGETADGVQRPMLNVFHRGRDGIRHFWGSELLYAVSDPGQDPRHVGTLEPRVEPLRPHPRRATGLVRAVQLHMKRQARRSAALVTASSPCGVGAPLTHLCTPARPCF